MKVGDTVYAACVGFDGEVEVAEAKVIQAGPKQVKIDRDHKAWRYLRTVSRTECHLSRSSALAVLLNTERRIAQRHRGALEETQARIATIEAMLSEGKP